MKGNQLKAFMKSPLSYQNFIKGDHRALEQMHILLQLNELSLCYVNNGIGDAILSEPNTCIKVRNNVDWDFEVYKMKKAILTNREYVINKSVKPEMTRFANQIFLLAIAYDRCEIVLYFLNELSINVNQSIFGSTKWPSYFLFACACSETISTFFRKYSPKLNIGWNSLTPSIIASYKNLTLSKITYLDFITYKQYQLFMKYLGIDLVDSIEQIPIFPLDFACMKKNLFAVKDMLENVPELGMLTRLSFCVQQNDVVQLYLNRYGFEKNQSFNGESPLHISCRTNNLKSMIILCSLKMDIIKNVDNKWAYGYGSVETQDKVLLFFNHCTYFPMDSIRQEKKVFDEEAFISKFEEWMRIFKFEENEALRMEQVIINIKKHSGNQTLTRNRFNIVSLISIYKTARVVEEYIKKLHKSNVNELRKYTEDEMSEVYNRVFGR